MVLWYRERGRVHRLHFLWTKSRNNKQGSLLLLFLRVYLQYCNSISIVTVSELFEQGLVRRFVVVVPQVVMTLQLRPHERHAALEADGHAEQVAVQIGRLSLFAH